MAQAVRGDGPARADRRSALRHASRRASANIERSMALLTEGMKQPHHRGMAGDAARRRHPLRAGQHAAPSCSTDDYLRETGFFQRGRASDRGRRRCCARSRLAFSASPPSIRRLPPKLGEHTEEVLREAGFGAAEIAEIRGADRGLAATPSPNPLPQGGEGFSSPSPWGRGWGEGVPAAHPARRLAPPPRRAARPRSTPRSPPPRSRAWTLPLVARAPRGRAGGAGAAGGPGVPRRLHHPAMGAQRTAADWADFRPVWQRFYGDRNAVNLGFRGDATATCSGASATARSTASRRKPRSS